MRSGFITFLNLVGLAWVISALQSASDPGWNRCYTADCIWIQTPHLLGIGYREDQKFLTRSPPNFNLQNKVPGHWLRGETHLANKPRYMQIFPHSKFGTDRSTGLQVMAKKLFRTQTNFLVITYKPVDRLIPNFECGKICMFLGLFAKSVSLWIQ